VLFVEYCRSLYLLMAILLRNWRLSSWFLAKNSLFCKQSIIFSIIRFKSNWSICCWNIIIPSLRGQSKLPFTHVLTWIHWKQIVWEQRKSRGSLNVSKHMWDLVWSSNSCWCCHFEMKNRWICEKWFNLIDFCEKILSFP